MLVYLLCTFIDTNLQKIMTIQEINDKRKVGDMKAVSDLSGIPYRTIQKVLRSERSAKTKRGKEVIAWFSNFLECRENVSGKSDETDDIIKC